MKGHRASSLANDLCGEVFPDGGRRRVKRPGLLGKPRKAGGSKRTLQDWGFAVAFRSAK